MSLVREQLSTGQGLKIRLTHHNLFIAGIIGISRHVKGVDKQGRYGADNARSGWQLNCDGACGEMAVAKWLGAWYDGALGNFEAADVDELEVRTNPNDWGDLILHPSDPDDSVFILVLSHDTPWFQLCGWMYGRDGKKDEYWREGTKGRPAFFVPQSTLRPMEDLPKQDRWIC